jgi:hypothetical protein
LITLPLLWFCVPVCFSRLVQQFFIWPGLLGLHMFLCPASCGNRALPQPKSLCLWEEHEERN